MNFKTAEDLQTLFLQTLFASFLWHLMTWLVIKICFSDPVHSLCACDNTLNDRTTVARISITRLQLCVLSFKAFRKYPEKCLGIHFIPWWRCHHLLITTLLCPRGSEGGVFCQQILSSSESLLAARLVMNGRKNEFRWNTLFALIHSGNSLARAVIESCC